MLTRSIFLPLVLVIVTSVCYALFSYSLTAPNLTLTNWSPYSSFQTEMWRTFFNNRLLLTQVYITIITILTLCYTFLVFQSYRLRASLSTWTLSSKMAFIVALSIPFVVASSALSYDIFNYIFNAKMVLVYHANPHQMVALDFSGDLWTRFMHNTHTPAPYGYGWTAFSLLPSVLGFGKLLLTWFNFKVFSWISYLLLAGVYVLQLKKEWWKALLVLANPLVLIEIIGNSHNDLWMLAPAMISLILISKLKKIKVQKLIIPLMLLLVSVSVKLATIVLIPLFIVILMHKSNLSFLKLFKPITLCINNHWPLVASVALFVPLFLERSKWFLPWYSVWALVWLPLFLPTKNNYMAKFTRVWQSLLIGFSISSLYRYIPFLWAGNYDGSVISEQILITWVGGVAVGSFIFFLTGKFKHAS